MALMDAHELLLKAVDQADESVTDTALLTRWNSPFLTGANQAQVDLVRLRGVRVWQAVTLDANKEFELSDLTNAPDVVFDIASFVPYSAAASHVDSTHYEFIDNGETIIVPDATASTTVYVQYRPLPTPLVNTYPVAVSGHAAGSDATEPEFIPEQHQDCLIYKGLSEVYNTLRDDDSRDVWETKYFQSRSNIRAPRRQRKIRNMNEY